MPLTRATSPVLNAQLAPAVNRIINGKFAIDQRNAGAAANATMASMYGPDRWNCAANAAGVFTVQREADPLYPGEFRLKLAVTTADASIATDDYYYINQRVEGHNIADLNFGTANARPITIAFEVESTIAGTFSIAIRNSPANRSYVSTFTVNAANTRETKTFVIPGDTTGTWGITTSVGLIFSVGLSMGSSYHAATANVWGAGSLWAVAGQTNFMGTNGNTMRFRNIRLYAGAIDLGADQRLYAEELRMCQRYFEKSYDAETVPGTITETGSIADRYAATGVTELHTYSFAVQKRINTPSMSFYNPATGGAGTWRNVGSVDNPGATFILAGEKNFRMTLAPGNQFDVFIGHWVADAEL